MTRTNSILEKFNEAHQDTYRIGGLVPFDTLSIEAQETILGLVKWKSKKGKTDQARQAAGFLLYGLISNRFAVVVISRDNVEELILAGSEVFGVKPFKLRSGRKGKTHSGISKATLWGQLFGLLLEHKVIRILKGRDNTTPGVIEVIDSDWLRLIGHQPTDDYRLKVVNSVSRNHYTTIQQVYNAPMPITF